MTAAERPGMEPIPTLEKRVCLPLDDLLVLYMAARFVMAGEYEPDVLTLADALVSTEDRIRRAFEC